MSTILEPTTDTLSALRPSRYMLIRMDADVKTDCGLTLDDVRIGDVETRECEEDGFDASRDYRQEQLDEHDRWLAMLDEEHGMFGEEL